MRWVAVALLVCGGVAVYGQKKAVDYQARFEDYGDLSHFRSANADLPSATSDRVVFFGDSITAGWPIGKTSFADKPYINRGISGQTTSQMLVRFREDVIDLHPHTVVILAGTNDIAGNTGPMSDSETEANLASMAELAKAHGIKVILSSILPVAKYPWKPDVQPIDHVRAINAWIGDYCESNGCTYLDYFSAMVNPATSGMKDGLARDGVHPTAAGYAVMEPMVAAVIAQQ